MDGAACTHRSLPPRVCGPVLGFLTVSFGRLAQHRPPLQSSGGGGPPRKPRASAAAAVRGVQRATPRCSAARQSSSSRDLQAPKCGSAGEAADAPHVTLKWWGEDDDGVDLQPCEIVSAGRGGKAVVSTARRGREVWGRPPRRPPPGAHGPSVRTVHSSREPVGPQAIPAKPRCRYSIRCNRHQFRAYLEDMGVLTLRVTHPSGVVRIPGLSRLVPDHGESHKDTGSRTNFASFADTWPILNSDGQVIGTLELGFELEWSVEGMAEQQETLSSEQEVANEWGCRKAREEDFVEERPRTPPGPPAPKPKPMPMRRGNYSSAFVSPGGAAVRLGASEQDPPQNTRSVNNNDRQAADNMVRMDSRLPPDVTVNYVRTKHPAGNGDAGGRSVPRSLAEIHRRAKELYEALARSALARSDWLESFPEEYRWTGLREDMRDPYDLHRSPKANGGRSYDSDDVCPTALAKTTTAVPTYTADAEFLASNAGYAEAGSFSSNYAGADSSISGQSDVKFRLEISKTATEERFRAASPNEGNDAFWLDALDLLDNSEVTGEETRGPVESTTATKENAGRFAPDENPKKRGPFGEVASSVSRSLTFNQNAQRLRRHHRQVQLRLRSIKSVRLRLGALVLNVDHLREVLPPHLRAFHGTTKYRPAKLRLSISIPGAEIPLSAFASEMPKGVVSQFVVPGSRLTVETAGDGPASWRCVCPLSHRAIFPFERGDSVSRSWLQPGDRGGSISVRVYAAYAWPAGRMPAYRLDSTASWLDVTGNRPELEEWLFVGVALLACALVLETEGFAWEATVPVFQSPPASTQNEPDSTPLSAIIGELDVAVELDNSAVGQNKPIPSKLSGSLNGKAVSSMQSFRRAASNGSVRFLSGPNVEPYREDATLCAVDTLTEATAQSRVSRPINPVLGRPALPDRTEQDFRASGEVFSAGSRNQLLEKQRTQPPASCCLYINVTTPRGLVFPWERGPEHSLRIVSGNVPLPDRAHLIYLVTRLFTADSDPIQSRIVNYTPSSDLSAAGASAGALSSFEFSYALPLVLTPAFLAIHQTTPLIFEVWCANPPAGYDGHAASNSAEFRAKAAQPFSARPVMLGLLRLPFHHLLSAYLTDPSAVCSRKEPLTLPRAEYPIIDVVEGFAAGWVTSFLALGTWQQIKKVKDGPERDVLDGAGTAAEEKPPEPPLVVDESDGEEATFDDEIPSSPAFSAIGEACEVRDAESVCTTPLPDATTGSEDDEQPMGHRERIFAALKRLRETRKSGIARRRNSHLAGSDSSSDSGNSESGISERRGGEAAGTSASPHESRPVFTSDARRPSDGDATKYEGQVDPGGEDYNRRRPVTPAPVDSKPARIDVFVERAHNLPLVFDRQQKRLVPPDALVTFEWRVGPAKSTAAKVTTGIAFGQTNPVWAHRTIVSERCDWLDDVKRTGKSIVFEVWHQEAVGEAAGSSDSPSAAAERRSGARADTSRTLIGRAEVGLSSLCVGMREIRGWYHIKNAKGCPVGELSVAITPGQGPTGGGCGGRQ